MKRFLIGAGILAWAGFVITMFFIVQNPNIAALVGLADTLWTLLVSALLLFNAYGMGIQVLKWAGWDSNESSIHFLLGTGIGLGCQGILGFGFSVIQLANPPVLIFAQFILALFFVLTNTQNKLRSDLVELAQNLNLFLSRFHPLAKLAVILPFVFSFLLTFLPPFEAFDALFYHLTQPARILRDGGLQLINIPHFWFPNITENTYLWALALHSERATQMIHFAWGALSALLLWHWAVRVWNIEIGHRVVLLLAGIPSLPMLASWAYADMALSFYTTAALFAFTQYATKRSRQWLFLMGILCGLAMGIKYTSFVLPLTCGILLLFHRPFINAIQTAAQFSIVALTTASPWYLRNVLLMGNPFYPFAFGGRYWDTFQAKSFANPGTGIGWDILQIVRLPLDAVLGHRDLSYNDGRIGPLFLILIPAVIWLLIKRTHRTSAENWSLISISLFFALSSIAWTIGVINSSSLWQARLLIPALMPFAIPTAAGWHALTQTDTPRFRISFPVNAMIAIVIALTLVDTGAFALNRNPLAVVFGAQTREQYIKRVNPSYAELMQKVNELPADANIYNLFEPRSYSLSRFTQPDAILSNFAHDLYLFNSPDAIIQQWRAQGYTHVAVYERGRQLMLESNPEYMKPATSEALTETLAKLQWVSQTSNRIYTIYKIP